MAISEVILIILDVVLDNFLKLGKKFAKHKLQNRIVESARLNKSLDRIWSWTNVNIFINIHINSRSTAPRPLCYLEPSGKVRMVAQPLLSGTTWQLRYQKGFYNYVYVYVYV